MHLQSEYSWRKWRFSTSIRENIWQMKINTAILLLAIIRNRMLLICCFATTVIHVLSRTAVARLPVRLLGYCVTFVCITDERKQYTS